MHYRGGFVSNLKFRCLFDKYFCNIVPFKPYVEKEAIDEGIVLIAFDENELDTIRGLFKENICNENISSLDNIQLEGSDGYLYVLSQTSIEKKNKMPHSIEKSYSYFKNYNKKRNRTNSKIKKELSRNDDGIKQLSNGILSAYKFFDKENDICFPFRFHASKGTNKPLFIFFHGAGAMGDDNIKQLFDNIPLYNQVLKKDCNILLPQAPFGSNKNESVTRRYINSLKKLVDEFSIDFDRKRIYIVGTSFGGLCVWNLAYLFPDYFAAAVPVMGCLSVYCDFKNYDITRLVKTPFWVAHSSDDTNVRIDSDDYFVAELEKLKADIKYTRWNKYGHKMSSKFYKTEKWAEWCLSKEVTI